MQVHLKFDADGFRRITWKGDARVVDEQVEAALLSFYLIDRRLQCRLISQIEMYGANIARARKFGCSSDPLFRLQRGYDETRLEDIAEAAGISRRTFFAYFKSKDEILRTWERSGWEEILDDVRRASPDESPLRVIRNAFSKRLPRHNTEQLKMIAKVMSSSEALRGAKHFSFAEREKLLFEVLCEVWRQPERKFALRLMAMSAVGSLRVAVEMWELLSNRGPSSASSSRRSMRSKGVRLIAKLIRASRAELLLDQLADLAYPQRSDNRGHPKGKNGHNKEAFYLTGESSLRICWPTHKALTNAIKRQRTIIHRTWRVFLVGYYIVLRVIRRDTAQQDVTEMIRLNSAHHSNGPMF